MQQVQPAAMQAAMQSQQPWIILQQFGSPLVQVRQHPSLVISHLHRPTVMLQQQTIIPFIMQHIEHIPPAISFQRFCIMAQAAGSEQEQVIFIPSFIFSIVIVQRGTITMFIPDVPVGIGLALVLAPIEFIIAVTIVMLPDWFERALTRSARTQQTDRRQLYGSPQETLRKRGPYPSPGRRFFCNFSGRARSLPGGCATGTIAGAYLSKRGWG
jgi:hypothetical protein